MEYVAGGTLLDRCKQASIELEEAVDLACQLCDGLGRAHDAGIIHRDIKPANILLTADGIPKLTDFGLAKENSRDHTITTAGAVLGTLDFMPPEQRQDASLVDARSDLWSLAATLYQMVTGKSPKIIRFDSLPPSLTKVLGQALEENKDDRYRNSTELRTALLGSQSNPELTAPMIQDLGAGECPQCHTLNESSRKFCRECAAPLLVPCLQCSEPMAIWDKVCGECGARQQNLLEERNAQHTSQREEAERLRADYHFSEVIDLLKPLQSIEDQRFKEISEWAKNYVSEVKAEAERRPQEAQELFAESQKHSKAFDYAAAISTMQQIPAPWITTDMVQHRRDMEAAELESEHVLALIKQAIKSNDLDDLLPVVERGIELRGDRKDLPKLRAQLQRKIDQQQQRKASALVEANTLIDSQKYEQALSVLSQLPEKLADHEVRRLTKSTTAMLQELRSVEDAIISKESDPNTELIELIHLLQSYLQLKRDDSAREQQLNDLVAKRDKMVSQEKKILVEANDLFNKQDYTGAIRKIDGTEFVVLATRADDCRMRYKTQLDHKGTLADRIHESEAKQQFNGLIPILAEYLELNKNDEARRHLHQDLLTLARANSQAAAGDHTSVLKLILKVKTHALLDQSQALLADAIRKRATELSSQSRFTEAINFFDEILEDDRSEEEKSLACVLSLLPKLESRQLTAELNNLRRECQTLAKQREVLLTAMAGTKRTKQIKQTEQLVLKYGSAMKSLKWRDTKTEHAYADFIRKVDALKKREKQRKSLEFYVFALGGLLLGLGVLVIEPGMICGFCLLWFALGSIYALVSDGVL